jgi:8-oxo-dGTP diphosphatase
MQLAPEIYFEQIAKKRVAVGVIMLNEKNEVLVLKPSYQDKWLVPGGVVEEGEAPLSAAIREVKEEINIDIVINRLVCVDYKSARDKTPDGLQFMYLANYEGQTILPDQDEIVEYAFLPKEQAIEKLNPALGKRLNICFEAIEQNTIFYLENSDNPFGKTT